VCMCVCVCVCVCICECVCVCVCVCMCGCVCLCTYVWPWESVDGEKLISGELTPTSTKLEMVHDRVDGGKVSGCKVLLHLFFFC
jgi:hypothetical protein